ncbi:MAG: 4-hydroxybenzoate octaprenyltransferase [Desulfovibrio sp.]
MAFIKDFRVICRMVKIEHSVFALPFAYMGLFLASRGRPGLGEFLALTVAMVAVRSFAMAVNRLLDADMDARNPRTQDRPLVTGELSRGFTLRFIAGCGVVFVVACGLLNWLCFLLAFPALAWSAFYSLTKRFTSWCHFALGSVLGLAPLAGWMAHEPVLALPAVLFFFGVTFWVAGFDLLYACQDADFDREQGLKSVPANYGIGAALLASSLSHVVAAAFFLLGGWAAGLGSAYYLVAGAVSMILIWEHKLISEEDMSRVNVAFFTLNGIIAVALFAGVLLDIYI